jgi:hypothetical protein
MGNLMEQGDTFIQSREKANNGYGQPGYQGQSSDLPGKHTTSGFLPETILPAADDTGNVQMRKIDASPLAAAHGMKSRIAPGGVSGSIPKLGDVQPVRSSSRKI